MKKSNADRQEQIARYVYDNGPQTIDQLQKQFKDIAHSTVIETVISNMVVAGKFCIVGYKYDVTQSMADFFDGRDRPTKYQGEIAPPRAHEFKPLSQKYMPNPYGRREGCEPRDITYKTMTSNIPGAARSYV